MKKTNNCLRFWELDSLRGIAIILMVIYHTLLIMDYFSIYKINFNLWTGIILPRFIQITFISLVGICLYISYERAKTSMTRIQLRNKFLLRGSKIYLLGIILTLFTWLLFPSYTIVFGILHFIGLSVFLGYYFLNLRLVNLVLGIIIIIIGFIVSHFTFSTDYFIIFGLVSKEFSTFDFFPLFPWFGVILIGIYLGNMLYCQNKRIFSLTDYSNNFLIQILSFLGKHSLLIYLIHIPLLILGLLII